jgi:hypothetical protein
MEIIKDKYYELIVPASSHFNIHIERETGGLFLIYRKTSGEKWDLISSGYRGKDTIDTDVYVPFGTEYKFVSESRPTLCYVTFADGTQERVEVPSGEGGDIPDGYMVFSAKDGDFISSDGKRIFVKI